MTDRPTTRPSAVRVTEALLAGSGLLFVVIAYLLAFLPLPTNGIGTCGPHFRSASAWTVSRDPDIVNRGSFARTPARVKVALRTVCLAEADNRLGTARAVGTAGAATMVAGPLLVELVWRQSGRPRRPRGDVALAEPFGG